MAARLAALLALFLASTTQPRTTAAAAAAAEAPRVAIIGAGVGGTAAAYFLREAHPDLHIELFERDRVGGRTEEVVLDGKTFELGASIIHGINQYVLGLARAVNLTLQPADDTGGAFSIWNGSHFVFSQTGDTLGDLWAVAKRYGVSPLRYKWLASKTGQQFGRIYALQQQRRAFATPEAWLRAVGLLEATQQSAGDFMRAHLARGWLGRGAAAFIEELSGAINRINYNQGNEGLNALAGLVSYLPAADPRVFHIREGNAALPARLAEAAGPQALHVGTTITAVQAHGGGQYLLTGVTEAPNGGARPRQQPLWEVEQSGDEAAREAAAGAVWRGGLSALVQRLVHPPPPPDERQYGPYDAVVVAAPLEGSGLALHGLDPPPRLPPRSYQTTVTSYVAGFLDASFFDAAALPPGDVFVTSSARTPFSVIASKGTIRASAVAEAAAAAAGAAADGLSRQQQQQRQQQQRRRRQQGGDDDEELPLWKVFSEKPLGWRELRLLFVNGTLLASRTWAAYPRFSPPESFAPFLLGPGLCYSNALENAASAMEVAALAAKNCALLVEQHLASGAVQQQRRQQRHSAALRPPGTDAAGAKVAAA